MTSAICHGMSHLVGQVKVGCLADLVLYKPANFGARPEMIIKGGVIAWAHVRSLRDCLSTSQAVPADRSGWRCERLHTDCPASHRPAHVGRRAVRRAAQLDPLGQPGFFG